MRGLVIATRGSRLALWQAGHVREALLSLEPERSVELKIIRTKGDKILDVPLSQVGGKGLFVKEIEEALLEGGADLAVHSVKDVPMLLPEGLVLGCVPRRESERDCLCSERFASLEELPLGARVGTSSLRRQAQLKALRPDLEIVSLRGNVDTRLSRMKEGAFDAVVLAMAGLSRLGLSAARMAPLPPSTLLPAVGQGALGLECRSGDQEVLELVRRLEHRPTRLCVEAERALLRALDGGCQVPIGAWAVLEGEELVLEGLVAETDGGLVLRRSRRGPAAEPEALGQALARELLDAGAGEILARLQA